MAQRRIVDEELTQQGVEQSLWKAADILRGAVRPERYGSYMLPLLFFKRLSDVWIDEYEEGLEKYKSPEAAKQKFVHRFVIPEGCLWDDVRKEGRNLGERLNNVLEKIVKSNPELEGVLNRTDFNRQEEILPDRLIKLFEHFSQYKLGKRYVAPDLLGNAYEYLLKQFNEIAPQRAGEFYTPREVVKLMIQILDPDENDEIYDPCCGSGGMLIFSYYHLIDKGKNARKVFLYGQEINADTWAISKANVMLHGMEAQIHQGDSFVDPRFLDGGGLKKFDIAITNPMWNQDGYRESMENDRFNRFPYGMVHNSSADWGWIQHLLASTKSNGRIGIVLDQGALFRGGAEGEVRKKVVEKDLVECVVALPEKLFYNTGAPGCLIFLNRNKQAKRKGKVLFVYAGNDFEKLKSMNRLREKNVADIVNGYRNYVDVPRFSRVVLLENIMENDCNLSVTRYVDTFTEDEQIDVGQVWDRLRKLDSERQAVDNKIRSFLEELGYERKG
jgi:type I restriction enzyme M protein